MPAPSITQNNTHIIFSNDYTVFTIKKATSRCDSYTIESGTPEEENLVPSSSGGGLFAQYATKADPTPVIPDCQNQNYECISYNEHSISEGDLEVVFVIDGNVNNFVKMTIACKAEQAYFLFELIDIDTSNAQGLELDDIEMAIISQLILNGDEYGGFIGAIHKSGFVVSPMALNMETQIFSTEHTIKGRFTSRAQSFSGIQLLGMKVALLGCPKDSWLSNMQTIVQTFGLPRPMINGVWDKDHPDIKTSYLFIDLTKCNLDEVIGYAKTGRFKYVMPYNSTWSKTNGTYEVNTNNYPNGLNDLQDAASKIHSQGLKMGLHCMSFAIIKNAGESLVSTPHPGLARESPVQLDTNINAVTTEILIDAPSFAEHSDAYKGYMAANEKEILIDNEIITVGFLDEGDTPPKFKNCQRGRYGTAAAPHDASTATIYHLPEIFGSFLADIDSNLPDTIAQNFATKFNAIDADMVFLDCGECQKRLISQRTGLMEEGVWYVGPFVAEKYRQKFQKGVIVQGSGLSRNKNFSWHLYSRGSGGDFAAIGVEGLMDQSRIGRYRDTIFAGSFFPMELGWMALLAKVEPKNNNPPPAHYASYPSTTLDEMEYQMNRSLGFDLPISLETTVEELRTNGAARAILKLIGKYEQLRLSGYFPEYVLEKLRRPNTVFTKNYGLAKEQYHLVRRWFFRYGFKRQAYLERVLSPGECWEFKNPFHRQRLKVKITALPAHKDFSFAGNIELLPANNLFTAKPGPDVMISAEPDGSWKATYYTEVLNARPFGWGWIYTDLDEDLSRHKMLEVKVTGDGRGEVLAIHLFDSNGNQRQFQFVVDFCGTKHIRFPLPGGNSFFDHEPWYGGVLALRKFDWSTIEGITIYIKKIPLDQSGVQFKLHSIKALEQYYPAVENPTLTIGNKTVTLPVSLNPRNDDLNAEPWDYVEFDGRRYHQYEGNNNLTGSQGFIFSWHVPRINPGCNTLFYTHNGSNLALVRILLEDHPEFQ